MSFFRREVQTASVNSLSLTLMPLLASTVRPILSALALMSLATASSCLHGTLASSGAIATRLLRMLGAKLHLTEPTLDSKLTVTSILIILSVRDGAIHPVLMMLCAKQFLADRETT